MRSIPLAPLAFLLLSGPAARADHNIVTVAGTYARIGDHGPATGALFNLPGGVGFDADGNCYISEGGGHRVRKIAAGIITTFAGLGGAGFNGDGIQAAAAQLNTPRGAVVDAFGNLFIPETGGHRIRRVELATGLITTVAGTGIAGSTPGGPATAAMINAPGFAVFDPAGNMYFTEVNGALVRKIVPGADGVINGGADELITTLAGNGQQCPLPSTPCGDRVAATTVRLANPNGLSLDAAGNLYIADVNNNRVRFINLGTAATTVLGLTVQPGEIATVVGNGSPVYNGDGIPALLATVNGPRTVTLDAAGNLFIADFAGNRVRFVNLGAATTTVLGKVVPPGIIVTVVNETAARGVNDGVADGDGGQAKDARLNGPNFVTFDAAGAMYIAESLGQRVRKVDMATGVIGPFAGGGVIPNGDLGPALAAQMNPAGNVAFDHAGNLFIADLGANRIRKVSRGSGQISTVAGNGVTGSTGDGGAATVARLNGPIAIAFDAAGNLYIADSTGRKVRRVAAGADGILGGAADELISTVAGTGISTSPIGDGGPATAARINNPQGLAFDPDGNLYVTEFAAFTIRKIVPGADGVVTGAADEIISSVAGNGLTGSSGDGGPATQARMTGPQGITLDAWGNLYIADAGGHRVRYVNLGAAPVTVAGQTVPAGFITTLAGTGSSAWVGDQIAATAASLNTPQGVATDDAGNVYIADVGNNRVRKVDAAGLISTVAGSGVVGFAGDGHLATAARLNGPRGVSLDAAGNVHVNDSANSRIRRLDLAVAASLTPGTLNSSSRGRWLTGTIRFPAGSDASSVDLTSLRLQAVDATDGALRGLPATLVAETGFDDNTVTFKVDRATVAGWATSDPRLALRVSGQLQGSPVGVTFSGDTELGILTH